MNKEMKNEMMFQHYVSVKSQFVKDLERLNFKESLIDLGCFVYKNNNFEIEIYLHDVEHVVINLHKNLTQLDGWRIDALNVHELYQTLFELIDTADNA